MTANSSIADEIKALSVVLTALEKLDGAQRLFVLKTAADRFKATASGMREPGDGDSTNGGVVPQSKGAATNIGGEITAKQFMAMKRPTNDVQRIACLGYFLTYNRAQAHFKTADLTKLNVEAAGTRIGNPAQAVANATKNSRFLAAAGGGKKQLTTLGEDVVERLPDQDAARAVMRDNVGTRPKRRAKAKTKAKAGGA